MPPTVLLYTDRPAFEAACQPVCAQSGLEARTQAPDTLADTVSGQMGAVFDAASDGYDEDELLACVGLARALGAKPAVVLPPGNGLSGIEDVLDELCDGLVARTDAEMPRIFSALTRRCDPSRESRFEYLTVSPRGGELLAILGDSSTVLLPRPVADGDDGSDIAAIQLGEDATSAQIELSNGKHLTLQAADVAKKTKRTTNGVEAPASPGDVDGVRLGARLRSLRLAAGLTQAELARRTSIHRPNIARVEAGRHTPSLETLSRLAAAIGVPTTRVLADS